MSRATAAVLAAGLALGLLRIALPGLSDPSEARYARIAQEMVERGDWIVPHWQGVVHLEKPPLAYQASAAGIALLGPTEAAVRLLPLLALLATAWLTADLARRLVGPPAAAPAAAALLLAPYPLAVGAAALTDGWVLFATALFFHGVVRHRDGARRGLDAAVVALAIGLLAKGHVVLLFTLAPLAVAAPRVLPPLFRPHRLLLLLALAAPWYAVVQARYPEFLPTQWGKLGDFAAEAADYHRMPAHVYLLVLAGGLLPWSLAVPRGVARGGAERRLALAWLLVPLGVLMLARSRSWTYVLPVAPALALLAARGYAEGALQQRRGLRAGLALLAGAFLLLLPTLAAETPRVAARATTLAWFGGAFVAGAVLLLAVRARAPWIGSVALGALLAAASIGAATTDETTFRIHRALARRLDARGPAEIWVVGENLPSFAFYAARPVVFVNVGGPLEHSAARWGGSPRFRGGVDVAAELRAPPPRLAVLREDVRRRIAPGFETVDGQGRLGVIASRVAGD